MITTFKGYGIYRQRVLCEYFKTYREALKTLELYQKCYMDGRTAIHEIQILRGPMV